LDLKLTFRKHLTSKLAKSKRLIFAIKSCISNQKGPNKLGTENIQLELQQLNRLAALSLGSVPRSSPTISLEVLYNLKPLELVMENIALKTHTRITQDPNRVQLWDGIGDNSTNGHLRH
jgi:hypothetical protein